MGTSQTRVSRWESGEIELADHQLDEALAICGAQRSGPRTLSDLLTPLRGEEELLWFGWQTPVERIRITALHCSAANKPLGGVSWPALLGVLKLVSGMPDCAVGGVVARSLRSPDRTGDTDLDYLDLRADGASPAWSLPARLPTMRIRVTQINDSESWWSRWPTPSGWPGWLVLAHDDDLICDVQRDARLGRSDP